METRFDIKFRLRPRRIKDSVTGESIQSTKNVLITMRVSYGANRIEFTTGYHINADCWDVNGGYAIGAGNGMSSDEINGGLAKHAKCAKKVFELFNEKEKTPTPEEFKSAFMVVKEGLTPTVSPTKETKSDTAGTSFENPDNLSSKHDNESPKQTFNNFSESEENKPINTSLTFWDVYYEYEAFNSKLNDWTEKTKKKYETIRYNVKGFRDWKRKNGLPNFDITFKYFDEDGLQSFVDYLREEKKYVNNTIRKDIVMLKLLITEAARDLTKSSRSIKL